MKDPIYTFICGACGGYRPLAEMVAVNEGIVLCEECDDLNHKDF